MRRLGKYKKINDQNFYKLGELLIVDIRKFGGTATFSDEMQKDKFGDDDDVLTGIQSILLPEDKDLLNAMAQIKNEVHGYVFRNSVPHELTAFYYIYLADKEMIEDYLVRAKERYAEVAQMFADRWEDIEKRYAKAKPKLYRPEKYPRKEALLRRFIFNWKWKRIMPADAGSDELQREIDSMKSYVLRAMRKSILDRMEALEKACTNGKLTSATLNSIDTQIIEKYERLFEGFIDNKQIQEAVADLKEYLDGTDAEMLRVDEEFRAMVAGKAKEVAKTIKNVKDEDSGRGLIF